MMKESQIRVAQVLGPVVSGGVDTVVMNYYRNIDRSQIQFDFIMDGYYDTPIDEEILELGGRVFKVEPYAKNMPKSMKQYYEIFKENHYPIVHSHMNTLSVFPLYAARRAGVPVRIAHNHSTAAKNEWRKSLMKSALRPFSKLFPTHCCACSSFAGAWLFGQRYMNEGNVHIINNAIDFERFTYHENIRQRVKAELGLTDQLVIGHAGRFVYQKNHSFLIDIFFDLHKRMPNSVLLLIGEGPLLIPIKNKVNTLGLTQSVLFTGVRQDVPDLMQAMDAFVFPSNYEGLGIVTIEAQAMGLPVICSTEIPSEAIITDNLIYHKLSESAEVWAESVLSLAKRKRYSPYFTPSAEKYDINKAAKDLSNYYRSLEWTVRQKIDTKQESNL